MEFCSARQHHSFSQQEALAQRKKSGKGASPLAGKAFLRPSLRTFVTFWFLVAKKARVEKGTVVSDVYLRCLHALAVHRPTGQAHLFVKVFMLDWCVFVQLEQVNSCSSFSSSALARM